MFYSTQKEEQNDSEYKTEEEPSKIKQMANKYFIKLKEHNTRLFVFLNEKISYLYQQMTRSFDKDVQEEGIEI